MSHPNHPPRPVWNIDRGAEFYGTLGPEDIWLVCVKPPSGMEKEVVVHSDGRLVSEDDFERLVRS